MLYNCGSSKTLNDVRGAIPTLLSAIIITCLVGGAGLYLANTQECLDENFCTDNPLETSVLIDMTDNLGSSSKTKVKSIVEEIISSKEIGAKISFYKLANKLSLVAQFCIPTKEFSMLKNGRKKKFKEMQNNFLTRANKVIEEIQIDSESNKSEILDAILTLKNSREIIVISDLMENSQYINLYKDKKSMAKPISLTSKVIFCPIMPKNLKMTDQRLIIREAFWKKIINNAHFECEIGY